MKNLKLTKEIHIKRMDVEKLISSIKALVEPLELGKRTRIVVEYDPEKPMVEINFWAEQ